MGYIVWEGASEIDQEPIVLLLTGIKSVSHNPKTGCMIQSWILRSDMHPMEALKTGSDHSICGNCPLRPDDNGKRKCYVTMMSVSQVYKSYVNGKYKQWDHKRDKHLIKWKTIRMGAYGDTAAVPYHIWAQLNESSIGHTGYTHQWRECDQRYRSFVMASVESVDDAEIANELGWRTYRIRQKGERMRENEIVCPGSKEAHQQKQCISCMMCDGVGGENTSNVAILQH